MAIFKDGVALITGAASGMDTSNIGLIEHVLSADGSKVLEGPHLLRSPVMDARKLY